MGVSLLLGAVSGVVLSSTLVLSLYVWPDTARLHRDHPTQV